MSTKTLRKKILGRTRLDPRLFTNTFHKYRTALETGKRYIVVVGGSNSSKSYSVHQHEALRIFNAKADMLVLRKNSVDVKESCYKLIKDNYANWGMASQFKFTYSGDNRAITNTTSGRKFLFRGANNIAQLKSLAGYSRALLEEVDEFEFSDFLEIDRRVRHPTEKVQLILLLNPVSEDHWVKEKLIDGVGYKDQVEVVHCTYHDNPYASAEDIARLEALKDTDEYDYEVYVLGKWGQVRTGKEYVHKFSYVKHVQTCDFIPGHPVHLSWDFNVNPYMTMLCYQIVAKSGGGYQVRQFDEFCLGHPLNSVEAICAEYLARYDKPYPRHLRSPAFVYGDSQGNNRIEGKASERRFDWVMDGLEPILHQNSDRTMRHNPSVIRQRDFFNNILAGKYPIEWKIDPRCTNTIIDNQKLKQGPIGFLKEMGKDAAGSSFEKYGHCFTGESYFAIGAFENYFDTDMERKSKS